MNYSIYRVSLDMHDTSSQAMLNVKQGDSARKIYISLTDGGRPYKITEDCTARLRAKTSNGAILFNDCTYPIKDNVIEYTLTNETCENVGIVECEVTLYGADSNEITSPRFSLIVEGVITSDGEIEATNEFTALTNALNEVDTLDASVSKVNDTATISITKKDGTVETATVKDGANGKDADTNLFANAVKGTASGKTIQIADVSPVEHTMGVQVHGKNLFDISKITKTSLVTNNGNGTITVQIINGSSGTSSEKTLKTLAPHLKVGDVYTLSATTNGTSKYIYLTKYDIWMFGTSLKITQDMLDSTVIFYASGVDTSAIISNIQIESGTTATEYTPHINPITITVTRYGADETDNPQTYTPNADGTVDGITSIYPTMTLLTDTEDAVINCEYNKDINKSLNSAAPTGESFVTADGTVVSPNADFAEVAEWADGNPDNEDRTGYFVCANVPLDGIVMKKATSTDDVKGVTILAPAFAGNYTKDKIDSEGNLLPKYSYVAVIGFVPVIDNGTCTVGGRCMPDDNGCAIPSSNSMGYQVVNRIDENRVLIIIEPNGDMVQRIKNKINELNEKIDNSIEGLKSEIVQEVLDALPTWEGGSY